MTRRTFTRKVRRYLPADSTTLILAAIAGVLLAALVVGALGLACNGKQATLRAVRVEVQ